MKKTNKRAGAMKMILAMQATLTGLCCALLAPNRPSWPPDRASWPRDRPSWPQDRQVGPQDRPN